MQNPLNVDATLVFVGSAYRLPASLPLIITCAFEPQLNIQAYKVWQHLVNIDWWEFVIFPGDIIFY